MDIQIRMLLSVVLLSLPVFMRYYFFPVTYHGIIDTFSTIMLGTMESVLFFILLFTFLYFLFNFMLVGIIILFLITIFLLVRGKDICKSAIQNYTKYHTKKEDF